MAQTSETNIQTENRNLIIPSWGDRFLVKNGEPYEFFEIMTHWAPDGDGDVYTELTRRELIEITMLKDDPTLAWLGAVQADKGVTHVWWLMSLPNEAIQRHSMRLLPMAIGSKQTITFRNEIINARYIDLEDIQAKASPDTMKAVSLLDRHIRLLRQI